MDKMLYERIIVWIEEILRGIDEKVESISDVEWEEMKVGAHVPSVDNILWNQMIMKSKWKENEKTDGVELRFKDRKVGTKRIKKAIELITNYNIDFETLGIILMIFSIIILICMRKSSNFEMISVYLVFAQLGIMILTSIPTEIALKKHFYK